MALPKIAVPDFETEIPSSGKKIRFRPFLVKEEKILYMALEGNDKNEILYAVKKILQACILTEDVDINKFAFFDIEYLFLKLRSKSVGEIVTLKFKHSEENECKHHTEVDINLDDVKVTNIKPDSNKIMVTKEIGVILKYPTFDMLDKISSAVTTSSVQGLFDLLSDCIESVYDSENIYDSFSKKEMMEFIESLNKQQFDQITGFFSDMPTLRYNVDYTCPKCNNQESLTLEGLQSFFL